MPVTALPLLQDIVSHSLRALQVKGEPDPYFPLTDAV